MTILANTPYLFLDGRSRDAVAFYQRALEAELVSLQTFGDRAATPAVRDRVMHAELKLGNALLFLSDGVRDADTPAFSSVSLALNFDSAAHLKSAFKGLSDGGVVVEKVFAPPWGGSFGIVTDRFGVQWMLSSDDAG
jgi:PhnB protein